MEGNIKITKSEDQLPINKAFDIKNALKEIGKKVIPLQENYTTFARILLDELLIPKNAIHYTFQLLNQRPSFSETEIREIENLYKRVKTQQTQQGNE